MKIDRTAAAAIAAKLALVRSHSLVSSRDSVTQAENPHRFAARGAAFPACCNRVRTPCACRDCARTCSSGRPPFFGGDLRPLPA